jgi:hypothetical protein
MRRWLKAALLGGTATVLLTACALPGGVDGSLPDDWAVPADPVLWLPEAGTCHSVYQPSVPLLAYDPVPCTENHIVETVHMGTFTGADSSRSNPPPAGSPGMRVAYADCEAKAKEFLGEDWRSGRVWLELALPTHGAWSAGARWYRCELWETPDLDRDDTPRLIRKTSLRDALRGSRPLGFGCYVATEKDDHIETMTPIACDKPHNSEFAGIYVGKDAPYPVDDKGASEVFRNGCIGVIAGFAGVPNDRNANFRFGWIWWAMGEDEWDRGNRGVRCYFYTSKNVTRSMRGAGPKVLPVR